MTGRLAAALLADGVAVVVEGEFLTPDQRVEFTEVLPPAVVPLFVTPYEVALRRAHDDPTRGVSRDPVFLREHYEASTQAVRDAPSTDLALDTNAVGVTEAARVIADWASRELALPTMGSVGLNDDKRAWELDELAHAGHEHLDALYVAGYDEKSPTDWSEDVADLRSLGIGSASTVVDLGAGTGAFAEAIAPHVRRVVAVDVSPTMVVALRVRGIEAVQAGFLTYEHIGDPPDVVTTRNALHHLPDFWKAVALSRIAAMLRPGGVLVLQDLVFSFDPTNVVSAIEAWLDAAPTDPMKGWTAEQLAEHVRTEHSTFTWLLEPMVEKTGFDIKERHLSANGIYASYVCTKRSSATNG